MSSAVSKQYIASHAMSVKRFFLQRFLGKVSLHKHFLFAFVLAFLCVVMPMAAEAQAPVTIDISTLGGGNADNSGDGGDSQWNYIGAGKVLNLNTANGDYTLSGSNSGIAVHVSDTAANAKVTFSGLNARFFKALEDCTVTLAGASTLTELNNIFGVMEPNKTCTIDGSGSLAIVAATGLGIALTDNSSLHIAGTASVTVDAVSRGIYIGDDVSINIGAGATLAVRAEVALDIRSNFALICDGKATFTGTAYGISGSGLNTPTFSGAGTVSATGGASGRAISVPAGNIKMGDGLTLVMSNNNSGPEDHTFERTNPASPYQWSVTGAATLAGGGSNATVAISIAPGKTGTVARKYPVNTWTALQFAAAAATCEPNVMLTGNIVGASQRTIACDFSLDLNGHALTIDLPPAVGATANGIKINPGITLTIMDSSSPSAGVLTVTNGADVANLPSNGNGAAINSTEGTLIINSGRVVATGGFNGAGIGGGSNGTGGAITINGGTVIAKGGNQGAGIGGGEDGAGGTITINSGTVNATGGYVGAGIGGGRLGAGGTINISGTADVTANGNSFGAGIGGGDGGAGGAINISGGTVEATGGSNGAGIGGGEDGAGGAITISGGTVTANNSGYAGAGIGGGNRGAGGNIEISGSAIVTASGSDGNGVYGGGAGIGSGGAGGAVAMAVGAITINTTGTVTATGGAAVASPGTGGAGAAIGQGGYDGGDGEPVLPTVPRSFTATPGNGQVTLSWIAPALPVSGLPITGYEVSRDMAQPGSTPAP